MNVGEWVEWTSTASGTRRYHRGQIAAVVPPDAEPIEIARELGCARWDPLHDHGLRRVARSYLVRVGNQLYWPRVSQLRATGDVRLPELIGAQG